MCGIIGFYAKKEAQLVEDIFNKNVDAIKPRGIDLDIVKRENCEFYAYSRLPTDDINNNSLNDIQRVNGSLLLFNGLITNTEYLQSRFHLPPGAIKSDTLALLHGFNTYECEFLSECRGMFAFAFITHDHIIIARDTIGIKPMYYFHSDTLFGFCSEIKGLRNIDKGKIKEVRPGEVIMFDKHTHTIKVRTFEYQSYRNFEKQDLLTCLTEAIVHPTQRYLEQSSDKKVGLLLSGGIDSSIILKMLHNSLRPYFKDRIKVFCLGVKGSSDLIAAQQLTQALNIELIHVEPYTEAQAIEKLSDIVYKVESNLSRVIKVALLQDALSKKIHEMGIEILLSGEGSDELFFGYDRYINGLTGYQIKDIYRYFFERVFYYTLLQRYERVFARRLIEGRVPYLDQEVVSLAKKFSATDKIGAEIDGIELSKLPLRKLAKDIGLPHAIYARRKEKMTYGVTKFPNQGDKHGYLEEYTLSTKGLSVAEFINQEYKKYFYNGEECILDKDSFTGTEEDAMAFVSFFKSLNEKKERKTEHI